jgi:6,7-dimethyl-8-ribityllumazine synthase
MPLTILEGDLQARNLRFAIVAARFNAFCVDRLLDGAVEALKRQGALEANIGIARVPGAFDLPVAVKQFADSGRYDAVIALGAVIRGATAHFDFVAGECAAGLTRVSLDSGVPVAFGVLTTDNEAQAMERAGVQVSTSGSNAPGNVHVETLTGNKGADAALCAIEMANLLRAIAEQSK